MATAAPSILDLIFGTPPEQAAALQRRALEEAQAAAREAGSTAAASPAPSEVPVQVAVPVRGRAQTTLVQGSTPAALAATYVAADAAALVQYVFVNAPVLVPPSGSAQFTYSVPAGQVLVLFAPITATSDLESADVLATVTVDRQTVLTAWALTRSAGVLLAAEAVVRTAVEITYTNQDFDAESVTTNITGVLLDSTRYAHEVAAITAGAYTDLRRRAAAITGTPQGGP